MLLESEKKYDLDRVHDLWRIDHLGGLPALKVWWLGGDFVFSELTKQVDRYMYLYCQITQYIKKDFYKL